MTDQEKNDLKKLISGIIAYYRQPIDHTVVAMYASDLDDLNFVEVFRAYESWRKDPKNKFAPLPAHIREIIQGPLVTSDLANARDAAARIIGAVSKFGHTNVQQAKEYIGEIGWRVVDMHGGWGHICHQLGVSLNANQCEAQWRDHALALMEKARAGTLDQAPMLPQPNREKLTQSNKIKELVGSMTKEIP